MMPLNLSKPLLFFAFITISLGAFSRSAAQGNDTVYVQTFTFGSSQDSTFKFPAPGEYQRVLMYYTLKCNPKQNPPCGQWDYLTYTYLYQHTGIMDSSVSKVDSAYNTTLKKYVKDTIWKKFEKLTQYELGRYITPYGISLSLGNGFTWTYDVTDYLPLLHDSVHLAAGNWQELLDLKFAFVKGTPARKPYKIVNMWNGNFNYGLSPSIGQLLGPRTVTIDPNAASMRMIVRTTGHGEDGSNCAEFCAKEHYLFIDSVKRWTQLVWRNTCAYNPVYPQGGTWIYQRANWCPGAEVTTYNFEATPYLTPGKTTKFNYDLEPYTSTSSNSGNSIPYYALETQLVYYEKSNFDRDVSIIDIISPSTNNMYARKNPVCASPVIVIRNSGTTLLTSADINYGIVGGQQKLYHWTGKLAFMEIDTVVLPDPYWTGDTVHPVFQATVAFPNGEQDAYEGNNTMYSNVPSTPRMNQNFVIWTRTNSAATEDSYTLKDMFGTVLYHRENMKTNTVYKDTVHLEYGCYQFRFRDAGEDGLSFFANNDGAGILRFTSLQNKIINTFNPDFGAEVLYNFNVGPAQVQPLAAAEDIDMYPNPTLGEFNIDASTYGKKEVDIWIYDLYGRIVWKKTVNGTEDHFIVANLEGLPSGMYVVDALADNKLVTKKIILSRHGNNGWAQ